MAATGAGWAALPINLSFGDAIKGLQKELSGPVAKAAKQAGDALEGGIGKGADQAAKAVEKAQYRVSPLNGSYWPWQYDNETGGGQDGYAGAFGYALDKFQLF